MKKVSTKILSLFLSLVLILGTVTVAFAADEKPAEPAAPAVTYDTKYFQSTDQKTNAKIVLDKIDTALKEDDMKPINLEVGTFKFTVDFTSVNGICKTIDTVYGLWGDYAPLTGIWIPRLGSKTLVGDLGGSDGLEFKHWTKGMSREKSGDVAILKNLITLLADNEHIINKFIDGKIDLGALAGALKTFAKIDIEKMFAEMYGDGDFSTMLKKGLVSAVYDEGTPAYEAGLKKALNCLDDFFYEDMMSDLLSEILPDFSMTGKTTFNDLINEVFNTYWPEIVKQIVKINVDTENSDSEAVKKLGEIMNLDGKTIHVEIPFNKTESFASQINKIVGYMAKQFFPKYEGWVDGDASKLGANLNALYLYVAESLGILDGIDKNNSSAVAFAVVKYILASIDSEDVKAYVDGIENCSSLEEAAAVVLRNTATINNIPVTADTKATYEQLAGDIINYYAGKAIDLDFEIAAGKDLWTVINDIANVFLYDLGFAKAFNLTTTKDKDVFTKLDELLGKTKIFEGLTGTNDYSSKTFLTGIIDSLFTLDIAKLVDITVTTFLKDFSDKSVANVGYDAIYNFLNGWFGKDILKKRTSETPIDDAVATSSIKALITNLLTAINEKKDNLLPAILYIGAAVIGAVPAKYEFKLDNKVYTGSKIEPATAKAVLDGKTYTVKVGRDYDIVSVTADNYNPGTTVTVKMNFYGLVKATGEASFKIILDDVKNLKSTEVTPTGATLTWDAVAGAQKYEVLNGTNVVATTEATTAKVTLTTGTETKLSVRAVYGSEKSKAASVTVVTPLNKAAAATVSSVTDTSLQLTWAATEGATGYEVEKYNGSAWAKIATVNATSYKVTGLSSKSVSQFRVRAYKTISGKNVYGEYSDAVEATTLLSATKLTASSATDTTAKLSWKAVSGAEGYAVEKYVGGKWTAAGTTTATSYTVTGLPSNASTQLRVVAFYKSGSDTVYGIYSNTVTAVTTITKAATVTATASNASTLKVTWSAVAGATGYAVFYSTNNKSWKSVTTTKTSTDLTKLSANTTYYIKVQAYKTSGKTTVYGPYSATINAKTLLAAPSLKSSSITYSSVKLSWSKLSGASGYVVEKYDGKKWTAIKTTTSTSYTVTKLKANTSYQFRVRAYVKSGSTNVYGVYSSTLKVTTAPTKISKVTASATGSTTVKVTWKKVSGASGYRVLYSTNKKSWKSVTTKKTSVNLTKLSSNKKYYVKVQAYKKSGKTTLYGPDSSIITVTTNVAKVTGLKASKTTKSSVTLTWKKVSGASGYTVYRQNGKKWVKVATVKSNSYTNKKLKKSTSYSYYVAAYKTVSKKAVYGDKSSVVKVKTKKS